jgi:anaerobic magnesium-protoporphyrin IX monomethyl ester cyclase
MNKLIILIQPMHGAWDKLFIRVPESLLSIAAAPYKEGYDVKILDQRITLNWEKKLEQYIKEKPICIGITSITGPSLKYAVEAASFIKRIDKDVKVVFGGVHVTLMPEQSLQNENIDIVVKGEGDFTFLKLIKALENNDSLDSIMGLYYKKDGVIFFTGEPEMILDMDSLPEAPYGILDMDKYSAVDLGVGKSISFQTSRGCPYTCKFCLTVNIHKNKWRSMSVEKIISKIKMLQEKYGYTTFLFLDDSTTLNPTHFRELLHALNNLEKKITWTTIGIRADLIAKLNREDIKLIWESGCKALDIGIESGNERVLKYINKGETKETMLLANKKLSEYPIKIKYTFMIGYPSETKEEINDTINFYLLLSKENPNAFPMIFIYTPIFGTPLYFEALQHNFEQPGTMDEWANLDYNSWLYKYSNWISKNERRKLEVINISSFFCNRNAKFKLTKNVSKFIFFLYHPIAKFRFRYKFFYLPIESYLRELLFK